MTRYFMIFVFLFALVFLASHAGAQETSGGFLEGSIQMGYDNRACSGALEGSIRYNSSTLSAEFCDGTNWTSPSSCAAPSGCTSVGDVCADGSLFAGFVIYTNSTCEALFVTNTNQSAAIDWKTTSGTNDIATDSDIDGRSNQSQVSPIANFPAFNTCETLNLHSKTDWYLPARDELHLLFKNRAAINANAAANFTTQDYWVSTEVTSSNAWHQDFSSGDHRNNLIKTTSTLDVRCVRRD